MDSDYPLVSVLIPAYNHESYIQMTIQSIINQSYQNIELIIVDDGSSDSTLDKIQEFKAQCDERFVRFHYETQTNQGTCATLNKLIQSARGEFIFIIASDDIAKPRLISKEVEFLTSNKDYALVVFDNEFIDENGKICYWSCDKEKVYDIKDAFADTFGHYLQKKRKFKFTSNKFGQYKYLRKTNHVPNGYLIRKSIFEQIGLYTPQAPLEDYWLMLQISKYSKLKFIDEAQFSYRWHGKNTAAKDEYLKELADQTRKYEREFIKTLDLNTVLPDVEYFIKRGKKYKTVGIPYLFEIKKYKNKNLKLKIKEFFIFNKMIFSQIKHF